MVRLCRSRLLALGLLALGCVPDFEDDTSQVTAPRLVAIRADPAEAAEGEAVTLRALVVARNGGAPADVEWSICSDRKPLSELGPISPRCLETAELAPPVGRALGRGSGADGAISLTLPNAACQFFGPQRPDPTPGEPSARPVDADSTGGFYQPVVAWLSGVAVLGGVRLTCPLVGASSAGLISYNQHFRSNQNPEPLGLDLIRADGSVLALGSTAEVTVAAGERLQARVTWPECPDAPACGDGICGIDETALADDQAADDQISCAADCAVPRGCGGAERYVSYDSLSQRLTQRSETFVVSWYATDGRFDGPRTDQIAHRGEAVEPASENGWTAPTVEGEVRLWAVVRDDRGGSSWLSGEVLVSR